MEILCQLLKNSSVCNYFMKLISLKNVTKNPHKSNDHLNKWANDLEHSKIRSPCIISKFVQCIYIYHEGGSQYSNT